MKPNCLRSMLCGFLALFAGFGAAQAGPKIGQAQPRKVAGLFWKASSATATIYLLGSIHLGSKDMYPLPKAMMDAFQTSPDLVVELDPNKVDRQKMAELMISVGMYPPGDSLYRHLAPDTAKKIREFADQSGITAAVFGSFKPWFAANMIELYPVWHNAFKSPSNAKPGSSARESHTAHSDSAPTTPNAPGKGLGSAKGIDFYFLDKAKGKKRIVEIETADFQMKLLASEPPDQQIKELTAAIWSYLLPRPGIEAEILSSWIAGDPELLGGLVSQPGFNSEFGQRMVGDRNVHMADVAESYLKKSKQCFLVVGAAHMVGPGGIVDLLRKRGYSVEQVLP